MNVLHNDKGPADDPYPTSNLPPTVNGKSRPLQAAASDNTIPGAATADSRRRSYVDMAGLVPAIHDFAGAIEDVDGRDKPGHDERDKR
jgi:hypothetical protein